MNEHRCGPDYDKEFFDDATAVFKKHPAAAKRYCIKCIDHEVDLLKIDFDKKVGSVRVDGDKIIKEFHDRSSVDENTLRGGCCEYAIDPVTGKRKCIVYWA
jgi:hypothetical protein